MIDKCRNCGRHYDESFRHDWNAVCVRCGQLLWLRLGDVVDCTVGRITRFGIMVKLGDGVEGLIHISELADDQVQHPSEVVEVGDLIQAIVLRVDAPKERIGLSRKRVAY